MTIAFALFLVAHGLIHLMGFAKAFGYAELPDLTQPIPAGLGVGWLTAAVLFVGAGALVLARPRLWWLVGAAAILVSTAVIVPSWRDARFGALANTVALVGVVFGALTFGPTSLRAAYDHDVAAAVPSARLAPVVTDADLARLPGPVRRYVTLAGAVGQPQVTAFTARMHGRIRSAPDAPWMPFTAEQHNVLGAQPARFFYLNATRALVPLQGYHRFAGDGASMEIRAAAALPVVRLAGPEMTQSETVTLFNDMCVLAPSSLLDPRVTWGDARSASQGGAAGPDDGGSAVAARFTHLGRTVSATLVFDREGWLRDFVSDDRYAAEPGGKTMTKQRWSTPLRAYKPFGHAHLASAGEARYHSGSRSWAYIELVIDDVAYVPAATSRSRAAAGLRADVDPAP